MGKRNWAKYRLIQTYFLLDTQREYLRNALSVPATARVLHVHENSVRHRLNRVRSLLGCDLNSPDRLAEVYVALMLRPTASFQRRLSLS
jgi:DNA-binding PucR family transcriptional regulator